MIKLSNMPPASPEIQFPVRWTYRAVVDGLSAGTLAALNGILARRGYSERFVEANTSKQGRYRSFHVEVEVPDRETMNDLGNELSAVPGVKFLL